MKNGKYILICCPEGYPGKWYRDKYAYEHIVEFWKKEGRMPNAGHVVHHKNGNTQDNRWENLEEVLFAEHSRQHGLSKPIKHGTHSGYRRGCRCSDCKQFHNQEIQAYRIRRKALVAHR